MADAPSAGGRGDGGTEAAAPRRWRDLDTPAVLVDLAVLQGNIAEMQARADRCGVALRPHFKTHKSLAITGRQLARGAAGCTVAKLDEAAVLIEGGVGSVLVANEVVTPAKIGRALGLARRAELILGVDGAEGIGRIGAAARAAGAVASVSVEIDSGLHRCGVVPGDAVTLAGVVAETEGVRLAGIFTHAGHAYGARSEDELVAIAEMECQAVAVAADAIRQAGLGVGAVSIGSTPTVMRFRGHPAVTELRPGNYVFMDGLQVGLGIVGRDRCALTVAATVISRPVPTRAVIDAGSKTLGLDRGVHGNASLDHFGVLVGAVGQLERLSEEHGVLSIPADSPLRVGDIVRVLPNHACVVANLTDALWAIDGDAVAERWPVDAAGGVH